MHRYLVEMNKDFTEKTIEYCFLKNFSAKDYKQCLKDLESTIRVTFGMHKESSKLKCKQDAK